MHQPVQTVLSSEFIHAHVDTLPLIPGVLDQLKRLSHESVDFYPRIAKLTQLDPLLAAKIISTAHTVPCGPLKPVYNIEKALQRIGVFNTLDLMSALTEPRATLITSAHHSGWLHSIETAVFSRFLAANIEAFKVNRDLAYIAGLLHDIGRFILLQVSLSAGQSAATLCWRAADESLAIEQYGFSHIDIGYQAAQYWHFPRTLTNMLRFHQHNDLWAFNTISEPFKQLLTMLQFASSLSDLLMDNPEWPAWSTTQLQGAIAAACIHPSWPIIDFPIARLSQQLPALSEQCQRLLMKR
ncbi:HDOD domain-containing protein [Amphritea sp. 1_MG-2023]|uniref:HDOD domain-containing protein n=1 Tax=Amphritea sp. 1_MG-2023 TaxID=3062670 RepID=UPI0026E33FC3|nr:HDOD domain-containing protein [Amphritea sp. 1_MG-2023]MDO6564286.1 HDOD domain-containing protein [Amphritea sp. 1_MG-2023]